jgi:nuclear transport factor 2 (NTF2) superfamily protein
LAGRTRQFDRPLYEGVSYGNELWEFDEEGLMRRRLASINDAPIAARDRRLHFDR